MVTMSIFEVLYAYGFSVRSDGSLFWGTGSLVRGYTALVRKVDSNRYSVEYHYWSYDCDGEPLKDERVSFTDYGQNVFQFLVEKLPLFR